MSWKSIKKFFRENPLMWIVLIGALLIGFGFVWVIYGGFTTDFSSSLADSRDRDAGDTGGSDENNGGTGAGGGGGTTTPLVNPVASTVSCGLLGGTVCDSRSTGGCRTGYVSVGQKTTDCDSGYGFCCKSSVAGDAPPAGAPPAGAPASGRTDPTGNCVYRTDAGAPNGGWYCQGLSCPLIGPNDGSAPQPAVRANTKYFHGTCNGVTVNDARIGCAGIWDMTPIAANGQEGYPPRDPAWTCTGPYTLGRSTCYNPSGNFSGAGTVTCQANTGLSGDSASVVVAGGASPTPGTTFTPFPSSSATPPPGATPTPVYPLLVCSPPSQTVSLQQGATVIAAGGDGRYQWELSGSGIQVGGTSTSVVVSYSIPGQKVVRASSAGQIATCSVTVIGPGTAPSFLTVLKSGRNTVSGSGLASSAVSVNPNEFAQFTISITNNGTTVAGGLRIFDTVPAGMSYRIDSTTINGQVAGDDFITTGGLALDNLPPGANVNVQWSAVADATGNLTVGPHESRPRALVSAGGFADATADMSVTVYGSGGAGSGVPGPGTKGLPTTKAGVIDTGPGDVVTVAFILAAMLTLLYSGYTRSDTYRRREASSVSKDQAPMDFRS